MDHAFSIGPLETDEGPMTMVCIVSEELLLDVEPDVSPRAALGRLLQRHPDPVMVEPSLADAMPDGAVPVRVAPLRPEAAPVKLSLTLSILDAGMRRVDPGLLYDFAEAATAFAAAEPWRWFESDQALRLTVDRGGSKETFEVILLGGAGRTFGVALYPGTGTVARLCAAEDPLVMATTDSLAVTIDSEPAWAIAVIEELFDAPFVPCPIKLEGGGPADPDGEDIALLTATLSAAAQLRRRSHSVEHVHETPEGTRIRARLETRPAPTQRSGKPHKPHKIGRNSPCPCGSGKKYKRCCLPANETAGRPATAPSPTAKASEDVAIEVFGWIVRTAPEALVAFEAACGEAITERPQILVPLFVHAFALDGGETPARRYLRTQRSRMGRRREQTLQLRKEGWLSLWEVLDVEPGRGLDALDLLTGERVSIRDVSASRTAPPRSIFLARVVPEQSHMLLDGLHDHPVGPERAHDVVAAARRRLRVGKRRLAVDELRPWPACKALLDAWREVLEQEPPHVETVVKTTDGEPMEETRDRYTVEGIDLDALLDRILEDDRVLEGDHDDPHASALIWTKFGNEVHPGWFRTNIGNVTVRPGTVVVETLAPSRADAIRDDLQRMLGAHLRFEDRTVGKRRTVQAETDGGIMLDSKPTQFGPDVAEAAEFRETLRQLEWHPQPWLDGQSCHEAVRKARSRRTVHQRLSGMEFRAGPAERAEIALLRRRLGLAIDGSRCKVDRTERELGFGVKASQTLLDLANPLLSEPLDDAENEALLHAAVSAWNFAPRDRDFARTMAMGLLTKAGVRATMAARYADMLVNRRALFDGDLRIFEVADLSLKNGIELQVITRAPAGAAKRWRRSTATPPRSSPTSAR